MAALGLVLAAGAAARMWRLGLPGLTSDEAFSWRLAGYPIGEIARRTAEDVHSPFYYVLLKAWLAVAGDAPAALRGLAVLFGLAAAAFMYRLVREAAPGTRAGALLAVFLIALHPLQVQQGRNARMYALGVLLAVLTAWLLLRALRSPSPAAWVPYGIAAAAFVYTHYYALFTLAAQAVGALVTGARRPVDETSDQTAPHEALGPASVPRGLAMAGATALVLLLPWLPAFAGQARRVQEEYWIPPASVAMVQATALRWETGLAGTAGIAAALVITTLGLWGAVRAGRTAVLFALQAVAPWALGLAVAAIGDRPLFLERFTVFAHVGLAALLGLAVHALPRVPGAVLAATAAAAALGGLFEQARAWPDRPPAITQAVRHLRRLQQPGDAAVADSPRALNKLLFYARQDGLAGLPARCLTGIAGGGHYTHHASLLPGELVARPEDAARGERLWRASERPDPVPPPPEGWRMGFARVFDGGEGSRYLLVRYDRVR